LNPIQVIDIIDNGAVIGTKFNTCSNNSYKQEMPMALMSVNGSGRNDRYIVEQNKSYNRFKLNCNVQLKTCIN